MYQGELLLHTGALPMSLTFQNKTSPNTPTTVIYRSKKILRGYFCNSKYFLRFMKRPNLDSISTAQFL